jgi:hypothetical protein
MEESIVFEKPCPKCGAINYTTEVTDRHQPHCMIHFKCRKCEAEYKNHWFGTGPTSGNEPVWRELVRKPFDAMCVKKTKGIKPEKIYQAYESLENDDIIILLENDKKEKMVEYPKELFIIGKKRHK